MKIARLNSEPEIFYSIQGEGARTGSPVVFLRLAGCNLHCSWCDTKHSWGQGIELTEEELALRIKRYQAPGLVITGGEPLMQAEALERLLPLLPTDMFIEVETNGTIAPTPLLALRVNQWNVSPKLPHANNKECTLVPETLRSFAETQKAWFKFVVNGEEDWANIAALQLPQDKIILMPCAATLEQLNATRLKVVELCLIHKVRFGDRLHVALWGDKKGV